ncbi:MAG: hypothetical protein ACFFC1_15015 [Promethearchaeota archaeon]
MNLYKIKSKFVYLLVAFHYGKVYISIISFLMITGIFVKTYNLPQWSYIILIPTLIIITLGLGILHIIIVLRKEVEYKNPLIRETHQMVSEIYKKWAEKLSKHK